MSDARAARLAGGALLALLVLPLLALCAGVRPAGLQDALASPRVWAALGVSMRTTATSLALTLALGTPLAWRLSRRADRAGSWLLGLVELPVVLPPAVLGLALLETFGRMGWLGPSLSAMGVQIPFTGAAVVLAQVLVAAPLYVLTATAAFRTVDEDLLLVARTLGASPRRAWFEVALPSAGPGLLSGAALAWARALGEFGATLMFAGSLSGRTQTLPLAIYAALERDLDEARALALFLVVVAAGVIFLLRALGGSPRGA